MPISSLIKDLGAPAPGATPARRKSIASPKEPRSFNQALSEAQKQAPVERPESVQRQARRDATPVRRNDDETIRRSDDRLRSERGVASQDKVRPETLARPSDASERDGKIKSDASESSGKDNLTVASAPSTVDIKADSEAKNAAEKGEAEKVETAAAALAQQVEQTLIAVQSTPAQAALTEAPPVEAQVAALLATPGAITKPLKTIEELPIILVDEESGTKPVGAAEATGPATAAAPSAAATPQTIEQPQAAEGGVKIAAEIAASNTAASGTAGGAANATRDTSSSSKGEAKTEQSSEISASADQTGKQAPAESRDSSQSPLSAVAKEAAQLIEQVKSAAPGSAIAAISAPAAAEQAQAAKPVTPAESLARADSPVPLQAVAIEIGLRAIRGAKEFAIRLDPEELGRVDIKLEISEAGEVQARLVVDRVETLQLLQRDAKTLERAFDQAGLKTNPDGLQFSLRDPGQQGRNGQQHDPQQNSRASDRTEFDKPIVDDVILRPFRYRGPAVGSLDISI
jgi:flagellar hook-length control protein FliK